MCGIAGWVDFGRDLRDEGEAGRAMADTLASRGPDASGVWVDRWVVLAHRRLSVIDVEGGVQPMEVEGVAAMTYSGEVYNYRELRAELEDHGHRFRTVSDTEVVLRAYLQWGDSLVDRLNGMYAFAIWDRRTHELLLVRDRMGIKPLFYYPTPGGVLFGSEPKAILAHPLATAVVGRDGLRELLTMVKTPGHGIYDGMHEVRPGQLVHVGAGGITLRRYWRLEALEHVDDLETTVATVRSLLEDIVRRQLVSDVPLCTLLSGGLDSSVLTALAAGALAERGLGPVRSFAVDFAGYAENFQPDALRETPDAPYVHRVADHVSSAHQDILVSTADLAEPANRAAVVLANDGPPMLGEMYTSLYLLFKAVRRGSTVALSGESADELFGGYQQFHEPRLAYADTFPWLSRTGLVGDRPALLDPALLDGLDLATYCADSYRDALADVPQLDGVTGHERRMREVCHLYLTRFVPILLDRKDRMSMASGLEVRVPFCDHRLVQYVFNTPWAMKSFDGREKSLLRAAAKDLLPESVAWRKKSPYPVTQDPAYASAVREELAKVLARGTTRVSSLLDVDAVRRAVELPVAEDPAPMATRLAIEQALSLNAWLAQPGLDVRLPH
ncbi:asparagine synthase (glutamine-hydrolyzing) [Amycolatopsis sp. H20-H5]|uniref:asparagine synthase (glutamine-hydrolyzing) n=1 Tax=Amycolatopsis sp. H20-H5 TaxID=3046309 RepID=UPI002DBDF590|nr:asparagine synthase (glutamine-hydrolyzing) [Amycolatopsis sp. H20-H5]MEC3979010.1 asparagine synthase (glutamine-hydrolyzing) [Amycolatopsis sp. H20-H5]